MTTTRTASWGHNYDDQFGVWSTGVLVSIAFRVTPQHERANWVATSPEAEDYSEDKLRDLVVEQLECLGITIHDVNQMKS